MLRAWFISQLISEWGMSAKLRCQTHGEQEPTFVCRHIAVSLDTRQAVGFHWPKDSSSDRPDAWCTECERVRIGAGGEWTDAALDFVDLKVLCGGCYDEAKNIWLEARQAHTATRH